MRAISEELRLLADTLRRPVAELARQHILEGVLRRLSASVEAEFFVLRGGMLARVWAGADRRVAEDLDFVGLYPFDVDETVTRFRSVLTCDAKFDDGIRFDVGTLKGEATWQETEFPGARIEGRAFLGHDEYPFKLDCGFNDPIIPAAVWFDYPALLQGIAPARVLACRVETAIGWKLHGLVDYGARRWRPKDLYDLFLLSDYTPLDAEDLVEAICAAFISRRTPLAAALDMLGSQALWQSEKSRKKWDDFRQRVAPCAVVDLGQAVARVDAALRPFVERCLLMSDPDTGKV